MMTAFDVVGLGVSAVDVLMRVDRFPDREAVQRAADATVDGGGPVATALVALARLGASTAVIDAMGDDWRGRHVLAGFRAEGVSVDHVAVHPGCRSAMACVLVLAATGARSIVFHPGDAPEASLTDGDRAAIRAARYLHVNGRHWAACLEAARLARDAGVAVSFDGGAHRYRPELRELVPLVDACIVARDFAARYTGRSDVRSSAEALLAEGCRLVAVTDGADGSWVAAADGTAFHQPAYPAPRVVDTTGCGDAYHGGFLYGLLRGDERGEGLRRTAALASAVAALNARALGGRAGLPTLAEAEAFLATA